MGFNEEYDSLVREYPPKQTQPFDVRGLFGQLSYRLRRSAEEVSKAVAREVLKVWNQLVFKTGLQMEWKPCQPTSPFAIMYDALLDKYRIRGEPIYDITSSMQRLANYLDSAKRFDEVNESINEYGLRIVEIEAE